MICFTVRSCRSWILKFHFAVGSYRSWTLMICFAVRSCRSWILKFHFAVGSYRSWILRFCFAVGSCGSWILFFGHGTSLIPLVHSFSVWGSSNRWSGLAVRPARRNTQAVSGSACSFCRKRGRPSETAAWPGSSRRQVHRLRSQGDGYGN